MFDYVRQWSLSTSLNRFRFCLGLFLLFSFDFVHSSSTLSNLLFRSQRANHPNARRFLRIIYFRENDLTIDEARLTNDIQNLTTIYEIDLKLHILDQSKSLLGPKVCSIISQQWRDTIFMADLYTKEIDLISRTLKIPTIAITNRYQVAQGKLYNPYLFKLMPDAVEEAKTTALVLETRSVYTRIALIYDISLDMIEYRLSYLRVAKQHIIYRAHLPRISRTSKLHQSVEKMIEELTSLNIDLILCLMSTDRQLQLLNLIQNLSSPTISDRLLNRTSWWFASRLAENRTHIVKPMTYTAGEDRRRLFNHFSSLSMKSLLNAILRTYIRLPISLIRVGSKNCLTESSNEQIRRTQIFVEFFANFTEWNCDIGLGASVDPILFHPRTLVWRVPTTFIVHTEEACQGMLFRIFFAISTEADKLFRSCRPASTSSRKSSSSTSSSTEMTNSSSNALVDISSYQQLISKLTSNEASQCRFVQILNPVHYPIIIGVVEPPYIFVSDRQLSSEFHCNYGIPCYKIDPSSANITNDPFIFQTKINMTNDPLLLQTNRTTPAHCCYGISVNLLSRMEDSTLIPPLKSPKLFVFSDKPNKWLALKATLKTRRAHFSISAIPYESFLARTLDLSPPFYHSSYVILTAPAPTGPSLGAFLQPFSWATWAMIFLILNATALFETFFEWHSPYGLTPKGRRRQRVFSLASALTLSWSIIFSHTFKTKSPKCWSNRFLGNVWGGFGIVFIAIYTAKLASFMVEVGKIHTASNIHEIVDVCDKMPQCKVGVVANTSDEEYLKRFFTNTLYRHIQYVSSYGDGIELLRGHVITYLLMDHSMARYYLTRQVFKLIRISGDNFGTFGLALGFAEFENELKKNVTKILLSYIEKGIIQRLHHDWYVYENCETKQLTENRVLSVDRFFGVFILLIAGMFIGLVILIFEWLTFKYAVPYWRRRRWKSWMCFSQRLFAALNASDDVFDRASCSPKDYSFKCVGERLHNYSTRSDSLDLRVVNVPKLLCQTYQLKQQMHQYHEEHQQYYPLVPVNGSLIRRNSIEERQFIRTQIHELEQEVQRLKCQLYNQNTSNSS